MLQAFCQGWGGGKGAERGTGVEVGGGEAKRIKMNTLPWYHTTKVQYSTMTTRSKHIKGSNKCYFFYDNNR